MPKILKLNDGEVKQVRCLYSNGISIDDIVKQTGLSRQYVRLSIGKLVRKDLSLDRCEVVLDENPNGVAKEYKTLDYLPGYKIGDNGEIWSKHSTSKKQYKNWRLLKTYTNPDGYKVCALSVPNKNHTEAFLVHRLILEAFMGPAPADKPLALHKNDIKTDNRIENLRWGSPQDNSDDMHINGITRCGEQIHKAKLKASDVVAIRNKARLGVPSKIIASEYGIVPETVNTIVRRATWKHVKEEVQNAS